MLANPTAAVFQAAAGATRMILKKLQLEINETTREKFNELGARFLALDSSDIGVLNSASGGRWQVRVRDVLKLLEEDGGFGPEAVTASTSTRRRQSCDVSEKSRRRPRSRNIDSIFKQAGLKKE